MDIPDVHPLRAVALSVKNAELGFSVETSNPLLCKITVLGLDREDN